MSDLTIKSRSIGTNCSCFATPTRNLIGFLRVTRRVSPTLFELNHPHWMQSVFRERPYCAERETAAPGVSTTTPHFHDSAGDDGDLHAHVVYLVPQPDISYRCRKISRDFSFNISREKSATHSTPHRTFPLTCFLNLAAGPRRRIVDGHRCQGRMR